MLICQAKTIYILSEIQSTNKYFHGCLQSDYLVESNPKYNVRKINFVALSFHIFKMESTKRCVEMVNSTHFSLLKVNSHKEVQLRE